MCMFWDSIMASLHSFSNYIFAVVDFDEWLLIFLNFLLFTISAALPLNTRYPESLSLQGFPGIVYISGGRTHDSGCIQEKIVSITQGAVNRLTAPSLSYILYLYFPHHLRAVAGQAYRLDELGGDQLFLVEGQCGKVEGCWGGSGVGLGLVCCQFLPLFF